MDSQPVSRHGIHRLLEKRFEVEEVANLRSARESVVGSGSFEVAVLGVGQSPKNGGGPQGAALIRAIRKAVPAAGIVIHAAVPGRLTAVDALKAGASAFVSTSSASETLMSAVEAAVDARKFVDPAVEAAESPCVLTKRQREILQLLADGLSTADTAKRLGVSAETVRTHAKGTLARLDARDRTHAVAIGFRTGLID